MSWATHNIDKAANRIGWFVAVGTLVLWLVSWAIEDPRWHGELLAFVLLAVVNACLGGLISMCVAGACLRRMRHRCPARPDGGAHRHAHGSPK